MSDAGRPEIAIVSTVVDHRAPREWRADDLTTPLNLAADLRSLAANDYRLREALDARSAAGLVAECATWSGACRDPFA